MSEIELAEALEEWLKYQEQEKKRLCSFLALRKCLFCSKWFVTIVKIEVCDECRASFLLNQTGKTFEDYELRKFIDEMRTAHKGVE